MICGHIHSAVIRRIGAIDYVTTGDWVESCTAVLERSDGSLVLVDWSKAFGPPERKASPALAAAPGGRGSGGHMKLAVDAGPDAAAQLEAVLRNRTVSATGLLD